LRAPLGPADFQRDRLPFDVAQVSESVPERLEPARGRGIAAKVTDPGDFWRGLCAAGQRPGRSAGEQSDEGTPLHSLTSSARASRVGGTVRLSALAVLRLRIISTLVIRCTGRSAGFSPLSMRPV